MQRSKHIRMTGGLKTKRVQFAGGSVPWSYDKEFCQGTWRKS